MNHPTLKVENHKRPSGLAVSIAQLPSSVVRALGQEFSRNDVH